jgi:hypothetical protein
MDMQFESSVLKYTHKTKRRGKKALVITCEILPPGSLRRNSTEPLKTHKDRWEEIVEICAETIAEDDGI